MYAATGCTASRQGPRTAPSPKSSPGGEVSVIPGINDPYAKPDVQEWVNRFETESREIFAQRFRLVEEAAVKPSMVVADVGAGTGLFTPLLSHAVGDGGIVLAVDIVPEFLDHIRARSREAGLSNIQTVLGGEDSVMLPPASVDLVFVCDTYHHFEFPRSTLQTIFSALKPGGRLVIVDFVRIPGKSREWIMGHVRAGEETVREEILLAGFVADDTDPDDSFLSENYIAAFRKPG